jgi:hypothetical protein
MREAEESPLLKVVARERLLETLQAAEQSVVICEAWRSAIEL